MAGTSNAYDSAVRTAKRAGGWFTVCVALALVPVPALRVFALLGAAISGWLLVYHGATAISHRLTGSERRWFNVAVAAIAPLLASLYFIKDAPSVTLQGTFGHLLSPWVLLPLVIIGAFSWAGADEIDRNHPFRGFLIAATVLWVLCLGGYLGFVMGGSDEEDSDSAHLDPATVQKEQQSGKYLGQYLAYVGVAYAAMLVKMRRQ